MPKIGMISLGCAKNQVNTEQMLWLLRDAGFEITGDTRDADAVVVNTCGFIESAKDEAIRQIIELGLQKSPQGQFKIIVAGCLSQRYRDEILSEMPEVDGVLGCGSYSDIVEVVNRALSGDKPCVFGDINAPVEETSRVLTTPDGWAYIKIAEGCDNRCAYCVIPDLRGSYRSRPMEGIIEEARNLAKNGTQELIVVAQDITRYGTDLYGGRKLAELLKELAQIPGLRWIRLHYLYPDEIDDELIDVIAGEDKVLNYLDIPIQHISDSILSAMNRRGTGKEIRELFKKLRQRIPGLVLRTSLIAGLPGEGEAEFTELCDFMRQEKIQRAGVFAFSPEEGTKAADMPRPSDETALRRVERLMEIQAQVMDEYNLSRVGSAETVLCEGYDPEVGCFFGRSYAESPDVDGRILLEGENLKPGDFLNVRIIGVRENELQGVVQ